jgi:hypothetical protein
MAGERRRIEREARGPGVSAGQVQTDLSARIDTIEEAYEFFLAYASQGLPAGNHENGAQARTYLERCDAALGGLAGVFTRCIEERRLHPAAAYDGFIDVIDRDAKDSQAAIQLVLALPAISSQVVDNLNASIHLRALLTDLFLIDEVLKSHA